MTDPGPRVTPRPASVAAGEDIPAPGVIGIGLAAVLTFALAQGSWQWFATFIGVTLLAVILAFHAPVLAVPDAGHAQEAQVRQAVAWCLAATTTLGLPLYGLGVAVLVGAAAWFRDRDRDRDRGRGRSRSRSGPVG
ncbi:hypothetical protein ACKI1I_02090 [Streptomyces turgidiscabies]|uniref:Uncharacterized protein n=1 Tax=Streptomyces turgidiscabies (strain Car8) TaxID=698760 RepID=L7F1K4_STRT8|nr:hypothetical protein [Streptomyces turgidiscabies]ELP64480.1 hypothetical protein STRTUCAR8_05370 [Streptomyces turgidiscabies Car8]MDX3492312.1 hypothetical protein [Streptomyces turgidiscabies]GAQ69396.1 hypothetical protein T45_01120 [Streptomyces turgidiscabies]